LVPVTESLSAYLLLQNAEGVTGTLPAKSPKGEQLDQSKTKFDP